MGKEKKIELKIQGMTCATCASTIEKSLSKLDGVINAHVNLGKETVMVKYDATKVSFSDFEKAVTDAGYQVINEKITLKIGGMTCATCVKTIENVLGKLDGITNVYANLGAEKAYITYNPKVVTSAEMKKAVEEAGYQYLGIEGEITKDLEEVIRERDIKNKQTRVVIGFTVGIPLMILMNIPIRFFFQCLILCYLFQRLFFCILVTLFLSLPIVRSKTGILTWMSCIP
jgi:Cu+-exporting ATPase